MSGNWNKIIVSVVVWIFAWTVVVQAQPKENSPYSRFGLGDIVSPYFVSAGGMGGITAAFNDPYHINLVNPGSYGFLKSASFDVGMFAEYVNMSDGTGSASEWKGNLNYMSLGFPLRNPINEVLDRNQSPIGWGMNIALAPYTMVGYNLENTIEHPETGTTTFNYLGNGGTYKLTWGNGFRFGNFGFGANLSYLFGKTTNTRTIQFLDVEYGYNDNFQDEISVGGMLWSFGAQYSLDFKETDKEGEEVPSGKRLVFGINGSSAQDFKTNSSKYYSRNNTSYSVIDTLLYVTDMKENGTLPGELSFGIMAEDKNKWKVGLDYTITNWSNYKNEAKPEDLLNSWRISVGGEYIPDHASYNSYLKKVRYRLGAFYSTDPRSISGSQLKEYALTAGVGLPVIMPRQQTSYINISLQAGQFGLSESLHETFVKFMVGFTLNDNTWFFKRKFN
ncbi:MAG: hypothetical protein GY705_03160 [Bacteroidetes bacterium]|nr:hypothetical protein [Bacteroidota bacterium]